MLRGRCMAEAGQVDCWLLRRWAPACGAAWGKPQLLRASAPRMKLQAGALPWAARPPVPGLGPAVGLPGLWVSAACAGPSPVSLSLHPDSSVIS